MATLTQLLSVFTWCVLVADGDSVTFSHSSTPQPVTDVLGWKNGKVFSTHTRHTRQTDVELSVPTNLHVTSTDTASVSLHWQYDVLGEDMHFLVKVYSDGQFIKDQVARDTRVRVSDLSPSSQYTFTVTAVRALPRGRQQTSQPSNQVQANTHELHLAAAGGVSVGSVGRSWVQLQWQYDVLGEDMYFLVKVYSDGQFIKDQVARDTRVRVSDLSPSSQYTFTVTAVRALPRGRQQTSQPSSQVQANTHGSTATTPNTTTTTTTTTTAATTTTATTTTTTIAPTPGIPSHGNHNGVGVCSVKKSPGVAFSILSCPLPSTPSLHPFARDGECGSVGGDKVMVNTVVLADCWGVATLLLQCHSDGRWHQYGTHQLTPSPPTTHLCQYQTINSPVCGKRAPYQKTPHDSTNFYRRPNWPWLVGLFVREKYTCSATLITGRYLLTAAHCVARSQVSSDTVDIRDLRVQHVGSNGTIQRQYVSAVWVVPEFMGGMHSVNDVGLVRLEQELDFSRNLYPACLATTLLPPQHTAATFSRTSSEYLWRLVIQKPDQRCTSQTDECTASLTLHQHQFCAINIDGDQHLTEGSSGGPYLVNTGNDALEKWEVSGVVSFSHRSASHTHCTQPVTVFTALPQYWTWLAQCVHHENCIAKRI